MMRLKTGYDIPKYPTHTSTPPPKTTDRFRDKYSVRGDGNVHIPVVALKSPLHIMFIHLFVCLLVSFLVGSALEV